MSEMRSLEELIRTRRSVREFADREVPTELLTKAVELATWAPNGGNRQRWHFYVVKDRAVIDRIGDAVKAKTELMMSWPEAQTLGSVGPQWLATSDFFRRAPALIAVTVGVYRSATDQLTEKRMPFDSAAREIASYRQRAASAVQSAGAAIGYLLLALHQMGLGGCYMSGPLQAAKEIEQIVGAPENWSLVALVPVGYPAAPLRKGVRKPVEEVMTVI